MTITLREGDSPALVGGVRLYGDASWRGLAFAGLCLGGTALFSGWVGGLWSWQGAAVPAATGAALAFMGLWRRLRSGQSWLLLDAKDGLYLNLAHSEGYSLGKATAPTLFISRDALGWACLVREVLRLPHRFGATRHHIACIDIELSEDLPAAALAVIEGCQRRHAESGKAGPYPVRLAASRRLRLCWSGVRPGEIQALAALGEGCPTRPARTVLYPDWNLLDADQQSWHLDELWRMGMTSEAAFLARMRYRVSLRDAKTLLEQRARRASEE